MNGEHSAPFSDLGTSLEAARAVRRRLREGGCTNREAVWDAIGRAPSTANEVVVATGLGVQTVTARIRGLVLEGKVVDSGAVRPSRPGSKLNAKVWCVRLGPAVPPERRPQGVGRLAAVLSGERELWRARVAIALSALESIEGLATIAENLAAHPLLVAAEVRKIQSRAALAAAQIKAEPEPTAVGLRPRRNVGGATEC